MLSIHDDSDVARLLHAATRLLDLLQSGELFGEGGEAKATATAAADQLELAIERLRADLPRPVSPFARFRTEITGQYGTAQRLAALTLHLWNEGFPVHLGSLFGNADRWHRRIALELICAYANRGERDAEFMALALLLRERDLALAAEEER